MIQLGIAAFYHDSAAALVIDGKVIAAVEEERFTGIKHDSVFPIKSISWVLDFAGLKMSDVDQVCWYENPYIKQERVHTIFNKRPIRNFWNILKFNARHAIEGNVRKLLRDNFNWNGEVRFVDHHLSHAAFSYHTSSFTNAAVVTIDGVGEWETMCIYKGARDKLIKMASVNFPHSMGMFYSTFTAYLGFQPNEGEYKVMGLAPYGNADKYFDKLMSLVTLLDNGKFEINQKYFTWEYSDKIMFTDNLSIYLDMPVRVKGAELTQEHKDLAAAVQKVYEKVFFHIIDWAKKLTESENLCLGGGSAYNGVANNKAYAWFKSIWIPFAPSDSGSAIGACLASYDTADYVKWLDTRVNNRNPYLGPEFTDEDVEQAIDKFKTKIKYEFQIENALISNTAIAINSGKVVGWFQGRMEFGARALGNRSILASPVIDGMKERLNAVIKKREGFRPFAPSCVDYAANQYFRCKEDVPYMNMVTKVKPGVELPSITHIDGSARVQTVSQWQNLKYYKLLQQLKNLSGYPIVLNTSFNFKDQTITMTPLQAIERFLDCEMDVLVINNYYITKI